MVLLKVDMQKSMNLYKSYIKSLFDYFFAVFFLILLSPILFVLWIVNSIVFKSGVFTQLRIGKNEKPFYFYKFRSMQVDGDEKTMPAWGKFIRKSSLDELPQLINVLRGEMSIIGPRPLLPEYLGYYNERQNTRHNVKPGITGLAQVSGRNKLSWKKSLELDAIYAETVSLKTDISILLRTIPQWLKFKEVHKSEDVSRESFIKGKKK